MWTFEVWAPHARSVEVCIDAERHAMVRAENGWWRATVSEAGPGTDYRYSVDGGRPVPDPRSAFQPHGVNGPSRAVDHSAFEWNEVYWQPPPLAAAIIYELHVGTISPEGNFAGLSRKLDRLAKLGVTHIELMPVNEFPGRWGWGYDGADLFAPHHAYGTPDDLKRLVEACHARGLAILLDVVYNHLGPTGNYLSLFGPYFTDEYTTPWGQAINLDGPESEEVRRFLVDNALMWLRDYRFDGLRLDAVHAFFDRSATPLLEQLAQEVKRLESSTGRHKVLIAESDLNDPRLVKTREAGGYGLDAQWSDDFHHALHSMITGERAGYYQDFGGVARLAKALEANYVYTGEYSTHRRRRHGRAAAGVPASRFLAYSQTHDQVGNRGAGERLVHLAGFRRAKIAAGVTLLSPFVPMLFQGEEFAASTPFQYFTDHEDPQIARAVSEGRRKEFAAFGWRAEDVPDPQDPETYQKSKLNWAEADEGEHAEMLRWYRNLIRLRRENSALGAGRNSRFEVFYSESEEWLLMRRDRFAVACNFGPKAALIPVAGTPRIHLESVHGTDVQPSEVSIPPECFAVLEDPGC